jgi:hypothetical protein
LVAIPGFFEPISQQQSNLGFVHYSQAGVGFSSRLTLRRLRDRDSRSDVGANIDHHVSGFEQDRFQFARAGANSPATRASENDWRSSQARSSTPLQDSGLLFMARRWSMRPIFACPFLAVPLPRRKFVLVVTAYDKGPQIDVLNARRLSGNRYRSN